MSGKFHATPQGAKPCDAKKRKCKYGEQAHADTLEEAQKLVEDQEAAKHEVVATLRKDASTLKTPREEQEAIAVKRRASVNVSANEHHVVEAMVHGNLSRAATAISQLPDNQRTDPFKGRSPEEIEAILKDLQITLKARYGEQEIFTAPQGNQNAQDLYATKAKRDVELKIGYAYTDAAIGMETAEFMIPKSVFNNLPTQQDRFKRVALYQKGKPEEARDHFRKQVSTLVAQVGTEPKPLAPEENRALNLFVAGVNRKDLLREHMDEPTVGISKDSYDLVIARKPKRGESLPTWDVAETRPYNPDRTWTLRAGGTTQAEGASQRLNLIFEGDDGTQVRFVYNQKNSYKVRMKDGSVEKTGYEYGMGSPSFNVWMSDAR